MVRLEMDLTQAREQAIQRLGELKNENINKVLNRSLKRATTTYQTSTKRETQKKYILKDKSIDDNIRIKSSGYGFFFTTTSRSRLVTHYDYNSVTKKSRRKRNFKAGDRLYWGTRVFKKNKLKYLSNSFWVPSKQKEGILLRRPKGLTGKAAHPKKKKKNWLVLGPAIGVIVKNQETVDISEKKAKTTLEKRIDHEVDRILSHMAGRD